MNTGIQDAWNLGWKLALVTHAAAKEELLDSYAAERWPVGRFLLQYTDRLFATFVRVMSPSRAATWMRRNVISRIVPFLLRSRSFRRRIFSFVSELAIHYRNSPIVLENARRVGGGVRAGERLPDAGIICEGKATFLQQQVIGPHFTLLLCGASKTWDRSEVDDLTGLLGRWLAVLYLVRADSDGGSGVLVDASGDALRRLGVDTAPGAEVQYLVRPDGYVAFRCQGSSLRDAKMFLLQRLFAVGAGTSTDPS